MQFKTTLRYLLAPVRMAVNKKTNENKSWHGYRVRRALTHCWWDSVLVQSLQRSVLKVLMKLKQKLPSDAAM